MSVYSWEYVTKLCLRFLFNIDPAHNTVRWASLNIKRCFYQQSLLLSLSPKQLTALRLYEKWLKSQNRVKSQTFAAATTSLAYARFVHKHYWLLQGLLVNEKKYKIPCKGNQYEHKCTKKKYINEVNGYFFCYVYDFVL